MNFLIVTGLSGAGKSMAVNALEDIGFFCIDNLPPQLIMKFADLVYHSSEKMKNTALVCDIRSGDMDTIESVLNEMRENGYDYEILFLEANDGTLVKRYKETRRQHPLAKEGSILDGIKKERELLAPLRRNATHILDTSYLKSATLKESLHSLYGSEDKRSNLLINVLSFGFKYGIPLDSDLVFDVRFLPNPFYLPELKTHTGLESCVFDYVMGFEQSREFLKRLTDMVEYLIPHYIEEGKLQLVISIGCTGGHHRSVTIAEALSHELEKRGNNVITAHRDIAKNI